MLLTIKDWKVVNAEAWFDYMHNIKDWQYIIKPFKRDRRERQNSYLWWCVYPIIAKYTWDDSEYIHGVMGMKFLLDNTKKAPYVRSTASLNTEEFSIYVENIKNFVADFWIIIPDAWDYTNFNDNDKNG